MNIIINVTGNAVAGLDAVGKKIQQINLLLKQTSLGAKLNPLGMAFNSANRVIDLTSGKFISLMDMQRRIAVGTDKISESFGGMNKRMLGLGLGMTFFMWGVQMQLQRVLRSMFNVFTQAEGSTGALNQQFNIVRANLAAISIAFFDAFAQSGLFEFIIDVVSRIADWYLDLTDKQKQWVTEGVIGAYGLIKIIGLIGQTLLAVYVISEMNPIVLGFTIVAIALAALAIDFAIHSDEIKTSWENLKSGFAEYPDLSWFDKLKVKVLDALIFLKDML